MAKLDRDRLCVACHHANRKPVTEVYRLYLAAGIVALEPRLLYTQIGIRRVHSIMSARLLRLLDSLRTQFSVVEPTLEASASLLKTAAEFQELANAYGKGVHEERELVKRCVGRQRCRSQPPRQRRTPPPSTAAAILHRCAPPLPRLCTQQGAGPGRAAGKAG